MNKLLFAIGMLLFVTVHAQTVRVPVTFTNVQVMQGFIDVPAQTNPPVINITTNLFVTVTNITQVYTQIVTNSASTAFTTLQTDLVDARLGNRLVRFMSGPANFTFTNLPPDDFITIYFINPGQFPISWQTNKVWWMGVAPTNQARGAVLIEALNGEIWITP